MSGLPWRNETGGLILSVRLTPKGGRDAIEGIERLANGQSILKVRVRAPPMEGEANTALIKLLARALGVPSRDVHLVAGLSARVKRVKIVGASGALSAALSKLCAHE